ncbi:DUF6527 family protein [Aquincola tertiaricarbonis]|uniref:DUF6527 family protein n=1 Tax=Aquincola tertiaricarbonis TaxID=391953 RepID=UPI0006153317|nr:DUF6527 family protein [Aquincola tertiaricarbonis]
MGMLSKVLRSGEDGRLTWWCPGCDGAHSIQTGEGPGPRWAWSGDIERPTFSPSVLIWWDEPANIGNPDALLRDIAQARERKEAGAMGNAAKIPMVSKRCHSFVVDGQMQMLADCTHALAGQTVPIAPWHEVDQ